MQSVETNPIGAQEWNGLKIMLFLLGSQHFLFVAFHRGTLTFEVRLITRHYHSTKLPLETIYFYFLYCQHSQKVVAFMVML